MGSDVGTHEVEREREREKEKVNQKSKDVKALLEERIAIMRGGHEAEGADRRSPTSWALTSAPASDHYHQGKRQGTSRQAWTIVRGGNGSRNHGHEPEPSI